MKAVILISMLCALSLSLTTEGNCPPIVINDSIYNVDNVKELCDPSTRSANVSQTEMGISVHYPEYTLDLVCFTIDGDNYCDILENTMNLADPESFDLGLIPRIIIGLILVGVGVIYAFFGLKYFKTIIFFLGFMYGFLITFVIGTFFVVASSGGTTSGIGSGMLKLFIIAAMVGIVFGAIFVCLEKCMIYVIGFSLFSSIAYAIFFELLCVLLKMGKTGDSIAGVIGLIAGIGGIFVAIKMRNLIIIGMTALYGGGYIAAGIIFIAQPAILFGTSSIIF